MKVFSRSHPRPHHLDLSHFMRHPFPISLEITNFPKNQLIQLHHLKVLPSSPFYSSSYLHLSDHRNFPFLVSIVPNLLWNETIRILSTSSSPSPSSFSTYLLGSLIRFLALRFPLSYWSQAWYTSTASSMVLIFVFHSFSHRAQLSSAILYIFLILMMMQFLYPQTAQSKTVLTSKGFSFF